MRFARAVVSVWIAAAAIGPAPASSAPNDEQLAAAAARATVDEAIGELLAALAKPGSETERLAAIEPIVRARLDVEKFAKFILYKNRSQLNESQLQRYYCEFDPYLIHYIGSRLVRYQQEKVEIGAAASRPNRDVEVDTKILGGNYDGAIVTFRMRESGEKWRVIDVEFEGVKVVKLLREEFESALAQGGAEGLLAMLQEKTPGARSCSPGA